MDAVQGLIDRARSERATKSRLSPEHAYYLGVEVAAEQVLHPDLDCLKTVSWLDRHNPAFVAGYVETTARLAPMWSWSDD
jgi:hypothetical protein